MWTLQVFIWLSFVATFQSLETDIKLKNQFVAGLFPDFNLCQIYPPVSFTRDNRFFTGAKPNPEVSGYVRYIVLHKCRWANKQDSLYSTYLNKAYECEDTKFVQVSASYLGKVYTRNAKK